jgi:fatty-acyl-CoA synthase
MSKRAILSPNKPAVIDSATGSGITYDQLNERATRLANFLRECAGVKSGDRICVLAMNRAEILETFFAAAKLTAILVPLNYRLRQPELQYIIEDCEPKVLLYENDFQPMVDRLSDQFKISKSIVLDNQEGEEIGYEQALINSKTDPIDLEEFDAEMPALIIYTSGTTGRPKGALLSHRMLTWNSINTNLGWDIVSSDITPVHAPLFHTGGFNVLTIPLLHIGGTVVMMRGFDAAEVLKVIEKYRCTVFFGVPTMFQMMMESQNFESADLSSIRFFISGGAPCPIPLIEGYHRRGLILTQGYGLTEVGPNCFKLGLEDSLRKRGSIGFPSFHGEARIVDENGQDVSHGGIGELILKGLHVCSGYWQNSEATAVALSNGWFYTGDLARQDEEGYYYIVGRAKDMIITGGENIYPAEVEAVLQTHPAIVSAALIGLPDHKWGETPVAVVIQRSGHLITSDEIIEFCSDKLARYKIPRRIFLVDEFPLSSSGKVIKHILKEEIEKELYSLKAD